jgi:hypothetical protein
MPQQGKRKKLAKPAPAQLKELPRPRRLSGIADTPDGRHPAWRLSFLDVEHSGDWSWQLGEEDLHEIVRFLRDMERLTWTEIYAQLTSSKRGSHRKHHQMPVTQLCGDAQRRLEELRLDDFDELFRFRLGNTRRLWGIIDDDVFYPVWWDANHKVYPQDRE